MTLLSQISYDFDVYDFFITSFFSFFGKFSCCLKSVRQITFSLAHFLVKVVEYLKLILISAITDAMLPRKSFFSSWLKNVFRIAKSCIQKVFCLLKYVFYFMINLLSREGGDTSNGIFKTSVVIDRCLSTSPNRLLLLFTTFIYMGEPSSLFLDFTVTNGKINLWT